MRFSQNNSAGFPRISVGLVIQTLKDWQTGAEMSPDAVWQNAAPEWYGVSGLKRCTPKTGLLFMCHTYGRSALGSCLQKDLLRHFFKPDLCRINQTDGL